MKTLLYATDLTSRADRALERACRIALRQRAKLHIVYVATSSAEDLAARNKELDDQIKEQLIEIAGPDAALPDYVIHADIGDPVRMIVAKIAELDPDLAVLGQSDDVAATEVFQGTSTDQIVSKTNHPVLVVRRPVFGDYRKAIVAFDHSLGARRAFEYAMQLAPENQMTIAKVIPDIAETPDALRNAHDMVAGHIDAIIQQHADETGAWAKPDIHLLRGRITAALHAAVLAEAPDLVALGRAQHTGLKVYVLGSTASYLLGHLTCDVLIL